MLMKIEIPPCELLIAEGARAPFPTEKAQPRNTESNMHADLWYDFTIRLPMREGAQFFHCFKENFSLTLKNIRTKSEKKWYNIN